MEGPWRAMFSTRASARRSAGAVAHHLTQGARQRQASPAAGEQTRAADG